MSIEYDNKTEEMVMECDVCGESLDMEGTWQECIDQAKKDGWCVFHLNTKDEWIHCCTDVCVGSFTE